MDLEQNNGREAGSSRDAAFEKNVKDILNREIFERTSVAARRIEERDIEDYNTETNKNSRARNEAAANGKLVFDGESGRKGRKRKTKDQIYGKPG